jgi:hypothetical protein
MHLVSTPDPNNSSPQQYSVGWGPLATLGYVTSTGYAPVGLVVTDFVAPRHGRVGPRNFPYCGSGGSVTVLQ